MLAHPFNTAHAEMKTTGNMRDLRIISLVSYVRPRLRASDALGTCPLFFDPPLLLGPVLEMVQNDLDEVLREAVGMDEKTGDQFPPDILF